MNGVDSNCSGINTPENIRKRRRRYSSNPSPQTLETLQEEKKSRTTHESESATELLLIEPENKIMGEKGENLPKVSITNEDIARIAIAVKDILKLDIEATVGKTIIEKQQPLLEKIEALEIKNHEIETKCKLLEEITDLKDENKKLYDKCDDLEQHSRKSLLRFSGVAFSPGENTSCKVVDIVKQIGVEIKVADIEVSHRTGKSTPGRPRQIIARIRNYDLKSKILKSAKNLRTTDGLKNISINQDLTKSRDELAFMARQYVRKKMLKSTWVIDGKIYVTTNGDKKYVFRRMKDFNAVMIKLHGELYQSGITDDVHPDTESDPLMDTDVKELYS